jgi:hypothetical protein
MAMQFNVCETCGAKDGRAGNLIQQGDGPAECENCRDTRKRGEVVIHSYLRRTEEEIAKTMQIVTDLLKLRDEVRNLRDNEDKDFCVIGSMLGISRLDAIQIYEGVRNV